MPRSLRAPPPSGVFYLPGLLAGFAFEAPGGPFAYVAQPMQVHPHRLDGGVMSGHALQVATQQPRRPDCTRHADSAGVQVDDAFQFGQPVARDLDGSPRRSPTRDRIQALAQEATEHATHRSTWARCRSFNRTVSRDATHTCLPASIRPGHQHAGPDNRHAIPNGKHLGTDGAVLAGSFGYLEVRRLRVAAAGTCDQTRGSRGTRADMACSTGARAAHRALPLSSRCRCRRRTLHQAPCPIAQVQL